MVNAAIAIEIILKSFTAEPVDNLRKGTVGEQYNGKRQHLLTKLAENIDRELYRALGFHNYDYWFKQYDDLFVKARCPYELEARRGHSEISIKIGIKMFKATIEWYKKVGNTDQWVQLYPEVAGGGL